MDRGLLRAMTTAARPTALRVCLLAGVAAAALLVAPAPALIAQQARPPTFRVKVDLVTLDVSVRRKNDPVSGLTEKNFVVYDNGVRQPLQPVVAERAPLDAWLVLDTSASVASKLTQLVQAAWRFVGGLSARDRAGLIGFSQAVRVWQPLTADLDLVRNGLRSLPAVGATALYDATYVALRLRERSNTRGVAVILTDGFDNTSWLAADRVVELTERSDLVMYGISVSPPVNQRYGGYGGSDRYGEFGADPGSREPPRTPQYRFLRGLAEASGGRVFNAGWNDLGPTFANILQEIRTRYLLTYYPTSTRPGWHKLDVKLDGAKGDVTARRGYWVAASK